MFRLTREVRFALNGSDDPQLRNPPANSFAGYPSLAGVNPQLALQITLEGDLQPHSGYLRNIKEIDDVVRRRVIPRMSEIIGGGQNVAAKAMELLHDTWSGAQLVELQIRVG